MLSIAKVIAAVLAVAASIHAAADFLVSVGSLRSMEQAERLRSEASSRLGTTFELSPAETPAGYFYRVVIGPFPREEAARHAADARANGYPKAWMLNQPAVASTASRESSMLRDDLESSYSVESYLERLDTAPMPETTRYDNTPYPPAPLPVSSITRETEEPVLVAPPGYKLNRLERE